jgi:BirA family transcriptional regulator, biotin operon repressor / biotin---[acetyl-CoA-carboxylase] ligase
MTGRAEPIRVTSLAAALLQELRAATTPVTGSLLAERLSAPLGEVEAARTELQRLGYEIGGAGGWTLGAAPDRLLPVEIRAHAGAWADAELLCFEEVDSTNTVARELALAGAAEPTVVTAEAQTRGRGRMGRSWESPARRNLYLSVLLRPDFPVEQFAQLNILAGVAACDAVNELYPATIKWPNDVLIDGRKVAGLLAESDATAAGRFVVLGIGVNLNAVEADFPAELRDKAISLRLASGRAVDRNRFAGSLLALLAAWYERLRRDGFDAIAAAWRLRSNMIGREVTVQEPAGIVSGRVLDLDDDGALRVREASGAERRIVAGDVSVIGGYERRDSGPPKPDRSARG